MVMRVAVVFILAFVVVRFAVARLADLCDR